MSKLVAEIEKRRAYRALDDKPVPDEVIDRILTAGSYAPSCMNNQPWRFLVVSEPGLLEQVKEHLSGGNYWAKRSHFIVAVCTKPDLDCRLNAGRDYALLDTGMAVGNLLLQGVHEGLHTHPIAGFSPLPVKEILEIPEDVTLVTLVIFGYPGEVSVLSDKHQEMETSIRDRKPLEAFSARGAWPPEWSD
jgi:nitroreductase